MDNKNIKVDKINFPSVDNPQNTIHVSCELMHDSKHASPIDISRRDLKMKLVYDVEGNPIIFSVGNDGKLGVIVHKSGTVQGWDFFTLTEENVFAFDAIQNSDGKIAIVYAYKDKKDKIHIGYESRIVNDNSGVWNSWSSLKLDMGDYSDFLTENVKIISATDENSSVGILLEGKIGEISHFIKYSEGKLSLCDFAEDVREGMQQISTDYFRLDEDEDRRAVLYSLYKIGNGQTLELIDDAGNFDFSPEHIYDLDDDEKHYNCFATILADEDNDAADLYVATKKGVYIFPESNKSEFTQVTREIKDVHELSVYMQGSHISVWALTSGDHLYYIKGEINDDEYAFFPPVLFHEGISHITAVCPHKNKVNELLLTTTDDSSLLHFWQNRSSETWHNQQIKVKEKNTLINIETFTTHLNFKDEYYCARSGEVVKVTASEWCYATINGKVYGLDRDVPAHVPTDGMGNVNIVIPTSNTSPPMFYIESDFLDGQALNIVPNGKVIKGLGEVKSGSDFKNAKTLEGDSVIDKKISDDELGYVVGGLQNMHKSGAELYKKLGDYTYSFVTRSEEKYYGALKKSANDLELYKQAIETNSLGISWGIGDLLKKLENALSGAWQEIKQVGESLIIRLAEGVEFQLRKVGEILTFVYKIGDKIYHAVMDQVHHLMSAINSLLQSVLKFVLKTLLKWLGFLFNWDDAWETHETLRHLMKNGLDYARKYVDHEIDTWKSDIKSWLGGLESNIDEQLRKVFSIPEIEGTPVKHHAGAVTKENDRKELHHPGHHWATNKMHHGGVFEGNSSSSMQLVLGGSSKSISQQFYDDVVAPLIKDLSTDLSKDFDDLKELISNFSSENFYNLLHDLNHTCFDVIRDILIGLLDFLEDLLMDLEDVIVNAPLNQIPLLSDLYEIIAAKYEKKPTLTILSGISFLGALLLNGLSKLSTGALPFAAVKDHLMDDDIFVNLAGPINKQGGEFENDLKIDYDSARGIYNAFMVANLSFKTIGNTIKLGSYIYDIFDVETVDSGIKKTVIVNDYSKIGDLGHFLGLAQVFIGGMRLIVSCPFFFSNYRTSSQLTKFSYCSGWMKMICGIVIKNISNISQGEKESDEKWKERKAAYAKEMKIMKTSFNTLFDVVDLVVVYCGSKPLHKLEPIEKYTQVMDFITGIGEVVSDVAEFVGIGGDKEYSPLIIFICESVSIDWTVINNIMGWANVGEKERIGLKATLNKLNDIPADPKQKLVLDLKPRFAPVNIQKGDYWEIQAKNRALLFSYVADLDEKSSFKIKEKRTDKILIEANPKFSEKKGVDFTGKISMELDSVIWDSNISEVERKEELKVFLKTKTGISIECDSKVIVVSNFSND